MKKNFTLTLLAAVLIFVFGCSSNSSTPVAPTSNSDELPVLFGESTDTGNHQLWQKGTIEIDLETMTAEVIPDRSPDGHYNITPFIVPTINNLVVDMQNFIIFALVTLENPYQLTGYDLRLIIYADVAGHRLLNFDGWTALHDDPSDSYPINPFRAFFDNTEFRAVTPGASILQNLAITIPGGNTSIGYAIDVSFPENCAEPYNCSNLVAFDMYDQIGSATNATVKVNSWNSDVNMVQLYLPQVTGTTLVPFTEVTNIQWEMELVNNTGAPAGEYTGYVIATTVGSGELPLFQQVSLTVSEWQPPECDDPPTISNFPDDGIEGSPYAFQFTADNGEQPLSWRITEGTPPESLSLGPDGFLSGEIDCGQIGEFEFTVEVTDSCEIPQIDVQQVLMNVTELQCDLLDIVDDQIIPDADESVPYFYPIEFTGGAGELTWDLTSGVLPLGMEFRNGLLSGIPDLGTAGDYPLIIEVTDSCCIPQVDTLEFTLTVNGSSSSRCLDPVLVHTFCLDCPDIIPIDGTEIVPLYLVQPIASMQFPFTVEINMTYDDTLVTIDDIQPGDVIEDPMGFGFSVNPGDFTITFSGPPPLVQSGVFAYISMTNVNSSGGGPASFLPVADVVTLEDEIGMPIPNEAVMCSLLVDGEV